VTIRCPILPIVLKGKRTLDYIGLLDSGADVSAIDMSVAEILDLDLSGESDKSEGIGGMVETIESSVNLHFSGSHERFAFRIPVLVMDTDPDLGMMLLGREGFFDKFVACFDDFNQKFTLKRNDQKRGRRG